jgi:hypothetical protein|tara:strand:+ start:1284 stop:1505 length:222 start_codon:yes stop_codon:yes gene_type:complete
MSAESDVVYSAKLVSSKMKLQVKDNLTKAVQKNMLTIDGEKIPGICMIVNDAIDQAFNDNAESIVNAVKAHTK